MSGYSTSSDLYGHTLNIGEGSRSAYVIKPRNNIGDVDTALRGEDPYTRLYRETVCGSRKAFTRRGQLAGRTLIKAKYVKAKVRRERRSA